jgi:hypothetical protein
MIVYYPRNCFEQSPASPTWTMNATNDQAMFRS